MNKFRIITVVLTVALLLALVSSAWADPPALPSSFWGEIHLTVGPPTPGVDRVTAFVAGITGDVGSGVITTFEGNIVYSIDVRGDDPTTPGTKEGGAEGDIVTFQIGTRIVGTGIWHGGTSVELNFATVTLGNLSQTYDGTPRLVSYTTDPTGLTANITYNGSTTAPTNAGSTTPSSPP